MNLYVFCNRTFKDTFRIKNVLLSLFLRRDFCVEPKYLPKNETIKNLQQHLDISYNSAYEIASKKSFSSTELKVFHINLNMCLQNAINKDDLLKYPEILTLNLEKRFDDLKLLSYPLSITFYLAGLKSPKYSLLLKGCLKGDCKIKLLEELLMISPKTSCEYLYKRDFLITKESESLRKVVQLLVDEANIPRENICKDLWSLRYSEEAVRERIELVKQHNIETIKTWMIRSPVQVIQNYAKRRIDTRIILGDNSLTEYLSNRLDCSDEQSKILVQRMPALKTKSLKRLKDVIDFLYNKGFKPRHIYRVPKILVHSIETIKKRLIEIEKKGLHVDSLYMLTKSQKQYKQYIESLKKSKKARTLE